MRRIAFILALLSYSQLTYAMSGGVQVDVNATPDDHYNNYYFSENDSDIYWYGPGWYWGIYFTNEDAYWNYHHKHHGHWHGREHHGVHPSRDHGTHPEHRREEHRSKGSNHH